MSRSEVLDFLSGKALCGEPIFMSDDVGHKPHKGIAISRVDFDEDGHVKSMEVYYNINSKVYKTTVTPGTIIGI